MRWRPRLCLALMMAAANQLPVSAAAAELPQSMRPAYATVLLPGGPAMLGTLTVPIKADRFDESLRRAREDASRSPILQQLIASARSLSPMQQIYYVQRVVSSAIRWESDATQWGRHDYWASASQTLARGAGDMEDRAIVKMQALHALGFNPNDLFLTLARDRVGGPETVLTVRAGGHYYVLDDTGGTPFLAEQRRFEFQPLISFGWSGSWVHVRPATTATAAAGSGSYAHK